MSGFKLQLLNKNVTEYRIGNINKVVISFLAENHIV